MDEMLKTLLLGIIQGITEFLPVSSSGHLVLAQTFMGMEEAGMLLDVILHLATGIAVLYVFRKDIMAIITGWFSPDAAKRKDSYVYSGWIILATLPAAFVGVFFKDFIDPLFDTSAGTRAAYLASCMLFVTAALLFFSHYKTKKNGAEQDEGGVLSGGGLTALKALGIGLIQAVAITPGISRSGSTIAIALLLGVSRTQSGKFSFMLALPAIFGAALLEARHIESFSAVLTMNIIIGFIASLIVGIISLKLLLTFIKKGKLHYFGHYCAGVAVISLMCLTFLPQFASK
jgi:undecaprenyl-diphosphatase